MRYLGLILLLCSAASAQLAGDGIVVTVSRVVNIPADQASFTVLIGSSLDFGQQQIARVLTEAGIPAPTPINIAVGQAGCTYPPPAASQVFYQISFTTPIAALPDLARKLDALRATPPEGVTSLQYAAELNAGTAAADSMHATLLPQLITEARTKAQALAAAASLSLGSIQAITESNYLAGSITGGIVWISGSTISNLAGNGGTTYTFFLTLKFGAK